MSATLHSQSGRLPLYLKNVRREFREEYMEEKQKDDLAWTQILSDSGAKVALSRKRRPKTGSRFLLSEKTNLGPHLMYQIFSLVSSQNYLAKYYIITEKWCVGVPPLYLPRAKGTGFVVDRATSDWRLFIRVRGNRAEYRTN
jgi:hypothetical protein